MPDVRLEVYAETHGAPDKLRQTEQALGGLERQGKETDAALGGAWKQFAAGAIAASVITKSLGFLKEQVSDSIKAAIDAERVDRALESSVMIVGQAYDGTADRVKQYAAELQRKTIYDDESIKTAQALIIQMRGTADGIEDATRGAIGLASVFKMDLQSAARAVAQGFEGNYVMLSRMIPAIRDAKTESEKHAAFMNALAGYYQRAEADAGTFGGQLEVLKNRWGEVQEATGKWVAQQKGVVELLNKGTQTLLDYLTMGEMLDKATRTQEENEDRLADRLGKAAAAAGWQYREMAKLIESYGGVTPALIMAINREKYGVEIKNAYIAALREEKAEWAALEAARRAAQQGDLGAAEAAKQAEAEFVALSRAIQVAHSAAKSIDPIPFKLFGDFEIEKPLYQLTQLQTQVSEIVAFIGNPQNAPDFTAWEKSFGDAAKEAEATMAKIVAYTSQAFGVLDSIFAQSQRNREIGIENEYKVRLDTINTNIQDETERQRAIEALEAEFEIKRTSAKRAAAKQEKSVAMMEAIVNTAAGISKALAQGGFVLGIPWAAVVGALGAVQVATIAAQPIPLAKGAYFDQPTVLPGADGSRYLVDEEVGNPGEIVSPVPMMKKIVREEVLAATPALAGVRITLNGGIHVHAQDLKGADIQRVGEAIYDEMQRQLRNLGRRYLEAR